MFPRLFTVRLAEKSFSQQKQVHIKAFENTDTENL